MKSFFVNTLAMLREHPLRAFLSLFGLLAGSFLLSSAWGISDGIVRLTQAAEGRQGLIVSLANGTVTEDGTFSRTQPSEFDAGVVELIQSALPGATQPSPVMQVPFGRILFGDKQYQVRRALGVGSAYPQSLGLELVAGASFEDSDVQNRSSVVLISEEIATQLFGDPQTALGKTIELVMAGGRAVRIQAQGATGAGGSAGQSGAPGGSGLRQLEIPRQTVRVTGVYRIPGESFRTKYGVGDMLMPYTAAMPGGVTLPEAFYWGTVVFNARGSSLAAVQTALAEAFALQGDTKIAVWQGNPLQPNFGQETTAQALSALVTLVTVLGLVLVLVSGVGMYGIMTVEVAGRTKQYGIRRALGASKAMLIGLVVQQALGIAILGAGLGVLGAAVFSGSFINALTPWFVRVGLNQELLADLGFNVLPFVLALASVLLSAALFGLLPALRLLRTTPVMLLREEAV